MLELPWRLALVGIDGGLMSKGINRAAANTLLLEPDSLLSISTGPLTPLLLVIMCHFHPVCISVLNKALTNVPAAVRLPYLHDGIEGCVCPDT